MRSYLFLSVVSALVLAAPAVAVADNATILDTTSFWRFRCASGTDIAQTEDGKLVPVCPAKYHIRKNVQQVVDGKRKNVSKLREPCFLDAIVAGYTCFDPGLCFQGSCGVRDE